MELDVETVQMLMNAREEQKERFVYVIYESGRHGIWCVAHWHWNCHECLDAWAKEWD